MWAAGATSASALCFSNSSVQDPNLQIPLREPETLWLRRPLWMSHSFVMPPTAQSHLPYPSPQCHKGLLPIVPCASLHEQLLEEPWGNVLFSTSPHFQVDPL